MRAIDRGERPAIPESCPHTYKQLVEDCWLKDPSGRPMFEEILARLGAMSINLFEIQRWCFLALLYVKVFHLLRLPQIVFLVRQKFPFCRTSFLTRECWIILHKSPCVISYASMRHCGYTTGSTVLESLPKLFFFMMARYARPISNIQLGAQSASSIHGNNARQV